ncbi:MAG: hypothetical protein JSR99_10335 [Proteobacteria bacterium]|nr:hypothetical protein [Pseudomonadota bacterium]
MQTRQIVIFIGLCILAAVVVAVAVTSYQRSHSQAVVDAPAVHVETDKPGGGTSVDAPGVHVQRDESGTKVEAPGVKIEIPPKQPQN